MAGYRIGMVVGNRDVIEVLGRIKSNIDSGIYGAVQDTATAALCGDQSWIPARNAIYAARRDKLCEALAHVGVHAPKPKASLYIWARVPEGHTSKSFTDWLLTSTGIAATPGTSYGEQGEGFLRMTLTVPDEQVDAACSRLIALGKSSDTALAGRTG
jgi:LL-diaminopimelate aminotransferase